MFQTANKLRTSCALAVVSTLVLLAGCSGKQEAATVDLPGARARYERGVEQLARGKRLAATDTLGAVQYASTEERKALEPLVRLAMADATFYQGAGINLIDARSLYLDFVTLYVDHPMAPYAQFQAAVCSLKQVSHPSKDQTLTYRAVGDFGEVERRFPGSQYAESARMMARTAEANLAEHEFLVGRFYQSKKAWGAAANRYRTVLDKYPDFGQRDKVYYYLGDTLLAADNPEEGKIYFDKLVEDFPEGRYAAMARKALEKVEVESLATEVARSP